jgi:Niemann-Pick C1 protein
VRVTLIIAEVIPFLVLAIGVDNVFILAHELERQNARAYGSAPLSATDEYDVPPAEERVGRALGRMGPSILLSSSCQTVAFGLGAFVGMPAVRNFAIYAAGAVAINALLQVTVFVAAMTVDLKRIESHRVDCLPCIKLVAERDRPAGHTESIVVRFIRSVYAPFLLKRQVKYAVVATFAGLFVASWICTDYIQLGLGGSSFSGLVKV